MKSGTGRALGMAYLVASVAGVTFFVLSVALLGYWPKQVLDRQTRAMGPEFVLEPGPSARRGRAIYAREGCAYCHTQQVRYLAADLARFGAPTLAWETRLDYPHLWGTRRIGPDLSRAAETRSDDWHFTHLFSPRAVVSQSVMPAYPRLFDGAPNRPRQDARDLVAYLNTLGRARELAGPEGEAHAREACDCDGDEMMQMAFHGTLNANPARARRERDAPALSDGDLDRGRQLYAVHCATCHGISGKADGPAVAGLLPVPTNLAEHEYAPERVGSALWNGVAGTAMPAWRDHPLDDLAALVAAVRALSVAGGLPPSHEASADRRSLGVGGQASGTVPGQAPGPEPALPATLIELGRRTYQDNCVQCHGDRGDGMGSAAAALAIAPSDLTRQRPTLARTIATLRDGIPGTPMAPWTTRLPDAELIAVAQYVRTLYTGPGTGAVR
jgi:cytochrome c oxidase cbb3-type subunit II